MKKPLIPTYMLKKNYIISHSEDVSLIIPTAKENSNRIFELDTTGKEIVSQLKTKQTLAQLIKKLEKKYPESEHKNITKHTAHFIKKLVKLSIVAEIKK